MKTVDYLKLQKKENKTDIEWELLKSEAMLRTISEMVTTADKHKREPQFYIDEMRKYLQENDY